MRMSKKAAEKAAERATKMDKALRKEGFRLDKQGDFELSESPYLRVRRLKYYEGFFEVKIFPSPGVWKVAVEYDLFSTLEKRREEDYEELKKVLSIIESTF